MEVFIGDVHGCINELQLLIAKLNLTANDRVIFVGDLIDKGPQSVKVVQYCRQHNWECVMGNHELALINFINRLRKYELISRWRSIEFDQFALTPPETFKLQRQSHFTGGAQLPMWQAVCEPQLHEYIHRKWLLYQEYTNLTDDDIQWLESLPITISGSDWIVVHGGFNPAFQHHYPNWTQQDAKFRARLKRLTFVRYVDTHGNPVEFGKEQSMDARFWASEYDGHFGYAIFGHQPWFLDHPKHFDHAIGIDTGCVFGNQLTAYCIQGGDRWYEYVAAERQYCNQIYSEEQ